MSLELIQHQSMHNAVDPMFIDALSAAGSLSLHAIKSKPKSKLKTPLHLPVTPVTAAAFTEADKSRICEMAWEDRTPFEAIQVQYGLTEAQTIDLMRAYMKKSSFVMWRKRMTGLTVKHAALRDPAVNRHRANNRNPSR